MDHAAVLALFDRDMREGARPDGPGARIERVGGVVRQIGFENGWSGVVWSDLDEAGADAAITEQIRYFSSLDATSNGSCTATISPSTWDNACATPGSRPLPRRRS